MKTPFSAGAWEEWMKFAMRCFPRRGMFSRLRYSAKGITIDADPEIVFTHPWSCQGKYEFDENGDGHWVTYVYPGFVNGRDTMIARVLPPDADGNPQPDEQVPLTDEDPAGLRLSFRNPLGSSGISQPDDGGDPLVLPGEGYPPFFETIGVKPAAVGGSITDPASFGSAPDANRTREIRACDVYLTTPRVASKPTITVLDPGSDASSIQIDTTLNTDGFLAPARHRLLATGKWSAPDEPSAVDRFLGTAQEPTTDELLIATIWVVSPENADPQDEPDGSWQAYPQSFCFWNLMHAAKSDLPPAGQPPITLQTGLAGGIADELINGLLSTVNDTLAQINAFLNATNFKGNYWTV